MYSMCIHSLGIQSPKDCFPYGLKKRIHDPIFEAIDRR